MPRVSICIPTYNSAPFLEAAIRTALAQEGCGAAADLEVIVCDNASTDETPAVCASFSDPRLRVVRYEELVGQAANWNRCVELASGEFVCLLHADDELAPAFARQAADLLDAHPEMTMVHCAAEHVDAEGRSLWRQRVWRENKIGPGDDLVRRLLLDGCVVNPAGVLVRRAAYERAGRFTEQIVWGVDWHMWIRLALMGTVGYLAEPLSRYREHGTSGTSGVMISARNGADEVWMMQDVFRLIPADRSELRSLQVPAVRGIAHRTWCFAEQMCREGHPRAARAQLRRAVELRPSLLLDRRVPTLWAATFVGYHWFQRLQGLRKWKSP